MPKEYIEREAVLKRLRANKKWSSDPSVMDYAAELVTTIPTADVVEVVRCRDCVFLHGHKCSRGNPRLIPHVKPNDFCSYGEQKGDTE